MACSPDCPCVSACSPGHMCVRAARLQEPCGLISQKGTHKPGLRIIRLTRSTPATHLWDAGRASPWPMHTHLYTRPSASSTPTAFTSSPCFSVRMRFTLALYTIWLPRSVRPGHTCRQERKLLANFQGHIQHARALACPGMGLHCTSGPQVLQQTTSLRTDSAQDASLWLILPQGMVFFEHGSLPSQSSFSPSASSSGMRPTPPLG